MLFGCPRQNINPSSENLKVIYIKCSLFFAIINYQFKTSGLKNVEKVVKQTVQALVHFWTICEIIFLVGGPWKFNVILEKSLKIGCNFLYEPCNMSSGLKGHGCLFRVIADWKKKCFCKDSLLQVSNVRLVIFILPLRGFKLILNCL